MKNLILAALTVISLGIGAANAATSIGDVTGATRLQQTNSFAR